MDKPTEILIWLVLFLAIMVSIETAFGVIVFVSTPAILGVVAILLLIALLYEHRSILKRLFEDIFEE